MLNKIASKYLEKDNENDKMHKIAADINPFSYNVSWMPETSDVPGQSSDISYKNGRLPYRLRRLMRDVKALKYPRTFEERKNETSFVTPANSQMLMATPEHMVNNQLGVARKLLNSNDAYNWRVGGNIRQCKYTYDGKLKCNVFPAYAYHEGIGIEPSPYRNKQRGDLLSASMLREVMSDPVQAKKYTDGEIINVPRQIAPYAEGATLSDGKHVGIVSKPYQTISAATWDGLKENTFGFYPEHTAENTKTAYFLPKGTDSTGLLQNAAKKYLEARTIPQYNRNWFTPESMAIINEQKARDLHGNVFIPSYTPVYDSNGNIKRYNPLLGKDMAITDPIGKPLSILDKNLGRY